MTKSELIQVLENKKNWTKSRSEDDLWTYIEINETIKVGRQRHDWSIFNRGKNLGFYFVENYGIIPPELIDDLMKLLNS